MAVAGALAFGFSIIDPNIALGRFSAIAVQHIARFAITQGSKAVARQIRSSKCQGAVGTDYLQDIPADFLRRLFQAGQRHVFYRISIDQIGGLRQNWVAVFDKCLDQRWKLHSNGRLAAGEGIGYRRHIDIRKDQRNLRRDHLSEFDMMEKVIGIRSGTGSLVSV